MSVFLSKFWDFCNNFIDRMQNIIYSIPRMREGMVYHAY